MQIRIAAVVFALAGSIQAPGAWAQGRAVAPQPASPPARLAVTAMAPLPASPAVRPSASALAPLPASPPARVPALQQADDPADSLYRAARTALQRGRFREAADLMRDIRQRYPRSTYVADSYYWEAYALARTSGSSEWRRAAASLDEQAQKYPDAAGKGDARALRAEVNAKLARQGDAAAAEDLTRVAVGASAPVAPTAPRPPRPPRPPRASGGRTDCDAEDDVQAAALQGLLQMDAARALPVLKKVLARRDSGSACLRRRAVFIVSQKADNAEPILLDAARNDPDPEVRGQAVFWLSQVNSPAATSALDSILRFSKDAEVRDKAIFALSQQESPRAQQILRDFAGNDASPEELREKAVFWIGQRDDAESRAFVRDLYRRTTNAEIKEKVLFAVSQSDDPQSKAWLLGVVRDPKESVEVRKKALFWVGQQHATAADLKAIYPTLDNIELREQLVFALSQSNDKQAVDILMDMARNDKDVEIRKKAIFWLGQSDDPRVATMLEQILTGGK